MSIHSSAENTPPSEQTRFELTQRKVAGMFALVVLLALAVWTFTYRYRIDNYMETVEGGTKMLALSFTDLELSSLKGTVDDMGSKTYQDIKKRLELVREGNPMVYTARLVRHDMETAKTIILVNSPPPGLPDTVLPGTLCPMSEFPLEILSQLVQKGSGVRMVQNPDRSHTVDGYSLAIKLPASSQTAPIYIIHYQVDVSKYLTNSRITAWQRAIGVILLFCLPLAVYLVSRGNTRQERALNELIMAIDQSENAISISTFDRHIVYANKGLIRQYGYSREELKAIKWWELYAEKPKDIDTPWRILFEPYAKPCSRELMLRKKNGEIFPASATLTPVHDKNGNVVSCITVSTDTTLRNKPNRMLEEAKQRAEEASRAKNSFLATMSHELRTPINGIVGFADLMLDTPLTSAQTATLKTIRTDAQNLIHLANIVLDITRIESAGGSKGKQACNLPEIIVEALDMAAEYLLNKDLLFDARVSNDVPETIHLDSVCLKRVSVHMVMHAGQLISKGKLEISARSKPDAKPCPWEEDAAYSVHTLEITVRGTSSIELSNDSLAQPENAKIALPRIIKSQLVELLGGKIIQEEENQWTPYVIFELPYFLPTDKT